MISVVYVNDLYRDEQQYVENKGVPTARISLCESTVSGVDGHVLGKSIIRGPKLDLDSYRELYYQMQERSIDLITSPSTFSLCSSAEQVNSIFGSKSPQMFSFSRDVEHSDIYDQLVYRQAKLPLFVRSEVESAAKYVGVDKCMIHTLNVEEISEKIKMLEEHVNGFKTIIFKQVLQIIKAENGKTCEYRGIVVRGHLISFDYISSSGLPDPESFDLSKKCQSLLQSAFHDGLNGAFFIDFGVKEDGDFFVVEVKDLLNGTIRNLESFALGLLTT